MKLRIKSVIWNIRKPKPPKQTNKQKNPIRTARQKKRIP